ARDRLDPVGLDDKPLTLGMGGAGDRTPLVVRLLDDRLGLSAGTLAHVARGLLGCDERLGQQVLASAQLGDLLLERLDLVGQLATFAPGRLDALRDLL